MTAKLENRGENEKITEFRRLIVNNRQLLFLVLINCIGLIIVYKVPIKIENIIHISTALPLYIVVKYLMFSFFLSIIQTISLRISDHSLKLSKYFLYLWLSIFFTISLEQITLILLSFLFRMWNMSFSYMTFPFIGFWVSPIETSITSIVMLILITLLICIFRGEIFGLFCLRNNWGKMKQRIELKKKIFIVMGLPYVINCILLSFNHFEFHTKAMQNIEVVCFCIMGIFLGIGNYIIFRSNSDFNFQ